MAESIYCKNCNTLLQGTFCHECGQKDVNLRRPFREIFSELLSPLTDFDKQLFRTLYEFFRFPGRVPDQYMEGKRRRYLPPIRLYFVFTVFLFTIIKFSGAEWFSSSENSEETPSVEQPTVEVKASTSASNEELFLLWGMDMKQKITMLKEDPGTFKNLWLTSFPYVLFFLLPFFSFLTWVFFRKSRPYYLSHLVFSASIQTMILFGLFLLYILDYFVPDAMFTWISIFLVVLLSTHIVLAMKRYFNRRFRYTLMAFTVISLVNVSVLLGTTIMSLVLTLLLV
ncbi:DUF3667 domain-containing protein [Marinilabilia rubra]|uniref:DUF3667 domain-containing protein n=1 Tax=Marinilabilia rubra TaxID=2162893 RepID=A0A2U2B711_9BACT|nr:DUF3667 domain-containing protein [Marinilabilia rubra]PWD98860.1 hypothetical protein DDZ16_14090 [Marinilabilia rubra]